MAEVKVKADEKAQCRKRSRHWDDEETKILISKWSEDNIQEKLKSCTRKKKIWQEIFLYLKACGYEDRDEEMCKTRIHTLTSAYRSYLNKRNTSGTARFKKPPCFEEMNKVLKDKSTRLPRLPHFSKSLSDINGLSEHSDALVLNKVKTPEVNNFNNCIYNSVNSTYNDFKVNQSSFKLIEDQSSSKLIEDNQSSSKQIEENQSSSKQIEDNILKTKSIGFNQLSAKPIKVNQSVFKSKDFLNKKKSFCFKKPKKIQSRSEVLLEKINSSIITFMTTRADADRKILKKLIEYHEQEDPYVIIKVRQVGDLYFVEIEFLLSDLTLEKLINALKQEFVIQDSASLLITKLPNVLIRNDNDVKRLKTGTEVEFLVIIEKK
ncbi:uncharacterized protein LOC100204154 isoform X1 [Hydra vulgaris]|uniref:Uncharacterized protein LOC100204154 isoform X1 n=1 Tax=Hydra vulgaris TaxID=6087 RepID=A0ABM4C5X8_HYDVU